MSKWSRLLPPLPLDGHTAVHWRHIRTSFTWALFRLLGLSGLFFGLSLIYLNNLIYLLALVLFCIGIFMVSQSRKQLYGLVLEVVADQEYFAGEPITLTLRVVSPLKSPKEIGLCLSQDDAEREENDPEKWQFWSIDAEHTTFQYTIPPQQRGYLPVLTFHCASSAPFALVRFEVWWRYEGDIVVYPRPVAPSGLVVQSTAADKKLNQRAFLHGEDLAFLLPHQQGTSMHQVAWKQYAKNQQLLDKYFDQHQSILVTETISYQDYPDIRDKEKLASFLCYRLLQAHRQGLPYKLVLPHQRFSSDSASLSQCLHALGEW